MCKFNHKDTRKVNNKTVYNRIGSTIPKENDPVLKNNRMLSDNNINALQNMLKQQYPDVNGLQDPLLRQALQLKVINETPFVQMLYSEGFHWVAPSQQVHTCQKLTIETLGQDVKYDQSSKYVPMASFWCLYC